MKLKFLPIFNGLLGVFIVVSLSAGQAQAQCPGCVIDSSCPSSMPDGGLCPEVIPAGTVGEAYDTDITFYIPQNVTDPGTGINVDVMSVVITSVDGLPIGMEWECNNSASGCTYTPPSDPPNSELGCVKVCGTPLGTPGTYNVTVEVIATVVAFGITLTQPQTYDVTYELLPAASGATTFDFTGATDCSSNYLVDFSALIDGAPNPTTWEWDFGNGNTGSDKNPPTQTYVAPGSYTASLTTTIYDYLITDVNLNSMNDNWCGDVEEPNLFGICVANPDPYFTVRDAASNVIYTSSTIDDVLSASWSGLSIAVDPVFSIEFTDEDLISGWDALGTFSFTPNGAGTYSFSGAGGTSGTINVGVTPRDVFPDSSPILAIGNPFVGPFGSVTDATTVGGTQGSIDLTISGGTLPYNFFWSNGATSEDISGLAAGDYTVTITDAAGCSTGGTYTVGEPANIPCEPAPAGLQALVFSSTDVLLSWNAITQPALGYLVEGRKIGDLGWARRKNAAPSLFVNGLDPGENYEFRVKAKCSVTGNVSGFSAIYQFTMPTAREGIASTTMPVQLAPNPSNGQFKVQFGVAAEQEVTIRVSDQLGRLVHTEQRLVSSGFHNVNLNLSGAASGIYMVAVLTATHKEVRKMIVE